MAIITHCAYCDQRSHYIRLDSKKNSFRGNTVFVVLLKKSQYIYIQLTIILIKTMKVNVVRCKKNWRIVSRKKIQTKFFGGTQVR